MLTAIENQFSKITLPEDSIPPIIVFANWPYLSLLENWIESVKRLSIDNYIIIAFDTRLHDYLNNHGYQNILLEDVDNLNKLWQIRIHLFRFLVDNNIDFIHSDADAIWLRNPIPEYYEPFKSMDLLISQGTIWPEIVLKDWGFVLCCGFFIMKSSASTKRLLERLEKHVEQTGDDQLSLNIILASEIEHWAIESTFKSVFGDYEILCSEKVIEGKGKDISLGVLPFKKFPRLVIPDTQPYVSHVLTPKNTEAKIDILRKIGTWLID